MRLQDVFNAKSIAMVVETDASNKEQYLGRLMFPAQKKVGLDLKWIKAYKGLPVSLSPSNFDAVSTLVSREGITVEKTEMAFFRSSMLLRETDKMDIQRAADSNDPYAAQALASMFNDAQALADAADVVPERMIMQLLSPSDGHPKISFAANGATYAYNYDPDGTYATKNFASISGETDKWSDTAKSDPVADVQKGIDAIEALTGDTPTLMIVSPKTMGYLVKNENIKNAVLAQNTTANVYMTKAKVKEFFEAELGIRIVVYKKKYKDEAGTTHAFFPDGYATLVPDGALGSTWYGTTPEELRKIEKPTEDIAVVNTGVALMVVESSDPVQTKTIASEIVLPSYERMDSTYVIKCY